MAAEQRVGALRQYLALLPVALGNLWRSRWASLSILLSVTLLMLVVLGFLGMTRGFEYTARNAGSDAVAVVLWDQATSESTSRLTREQVELLRVAPAAAGVAFSPEFAMTVSLFTDASGARLNMLLRGVGSAGPGLRAGFRLLEGRMYEDGRNELIIGRSLQQRLGGVRLGDRLGLAGRDWTVVGVFALDSAALEAELWAGLAAVQSAYRRENQLQSVRLDLRDAGSLAALQDHIDADPRLELDVRTERERYRDQVEGTTLLMRYVGWPLSLLLALGCIAGVFNIMSTRVYGQRRSIRILHLQGFGTPAIFLAVLSEAMLLSALGGLLGLLLALLLIDGLGTNTLGEGYTHVQYALRVDAAAAAQALGLAMVVGLLGGIVPAARGIRGQFAW